MRFTVLRTENHPEGTRPRSAGHRVTGGGSTHVVWLGWMLALTAVFAGLAAVNLDAYPPISGDEAWIMSVAYKLATQGVFGSDLYAGLFNAEQHYFIALPVH